MYSAIILNNSSRLELIRRFKHIIPNDWEIITHHMTINLGSINDELVGDLGNTIELIVNEIGVDDMAIAVGVSGYYSDNNKPHITLAINKNNGAKPSMSNNITNWKSIKNKFMVKGIVNEVKSLNEINVLNVFDFDGTLIDSPEPEEGMKKWKEVTGNDYPFVGWWGRPESLDIEIFDIRPFKNVLNELISTKNKPNNRVIILTSRQEKLRPQLENILKHNNIDVDEIIMRKGSDKNKGEKVLDELNKYPTINTINVYDDRNIEIDTYKSIIPKLNNGIKFNIYFVNNDNIRLIGLNRNKLNEIIRSIVKKYI